ncbi:Hypothetical predicted protein [Cloeon dipterum]|uniref:VWFA domain-containing protein n=1 Tax=Cloeon dipterum TaxID=197152 RepID=A0A8S1CGM2_9INSE|nr:Hypothetical predicted protein [Cloeon dipterum]
MTDFGRHLDELASRAEVLVKRIVCRLLSEKSNLIAQRLLALWEHYLETSRENQQKRTVTLETQLFHKRAKLLGEILEELETYSSEARDMKEQVHQIAQRALEAGALNAGGRFEWVDSLLVKCLRDGTWLLVENVNMCSAAVLDRLNALLEPGGSLTLGERGVNSQGVLHTVVPHPNFRLFFTMDPKYGEISRAMRNRGVEIYVHSPDEGSNALPTLDLCALLSSCGLSFHCEQQTLITVHKALGTSSSAMDPALKLSSLMQAAVLVYQNKLRGSSIKDAMRFACVDVFVKPKSTAESKKQALLLLDEILDEAHFVESEFDSIPQSVTQNLTMVHYVSALAQAKQDCALLLACLATEEGTTDFLNKVCDLSSNLPIATASLRIPMLLWIYKLSTLKDVKLRHAVIEKTCQGALSQLSTKMKDAIVAAQPTSDLAVMDDYLQLCLWIENLSITPEQKVTTMQKGGKMTALQYSQAVESKKVPANMNNSPVLVKLSKLLSATENCLEALGRSQASLSLEEFETVRRGLTWRNHILNFACGATLSRATVAEVVQTLATHFNWLKKHLLNPIISLKCDLPELRHLKKLVDEVRVSIEHHPLKKLAFLALPKIGQPLPFRSLNHLQAKSKLDELSELLLIWPTNDKSHWSKVISWLGTKEGSCAKNLLISTIKSLHMRNDIPSDDITNLESSVNLLNEFTSQTKSCSVDSLIHDYLRLLLLCKTRSDLHKNLLSLEYLLENLKRDPISQADMLALVSLVIEDPKRECHLLNLESSILQWLLNSSPVLNAPLKWLEWTENTEKIEHKEFFEADNEEISKKLVKVSPDSAVLSLLAMFQVFRCGNKLGEAFDHQINMQKISSFIWQATESLSLDSFNQMNNELELVKKSFDEILRALSPASAEEVSIQDKVSSLDKVTTYQPLLESCKNLAQLLSNFSPSWSVIGKANVLLGFITLTLTCALSPVDPVQKKSLKLKYTLQDLADTEVCLYANELLARVRGETTKTDPEPRQQHPLVKMLLEHCENLKEKMHKLSITTATRPEKNHYPEIKKMVTQYCNTLASTGTALHIADELFRISNGEDGNLDLLLNQEETWQLSQNKFCKDLKKIGAHYPDIVDPIFLAACRIRYGMYLMRCGAIKRNQHLQNILSSTCSFPCISRQNPTLFDLVKQCTKLPRLTASEMLDQKFKHLLHKLKMSSFEELKFQILARGSLDKDSCKVFISELSGLASLWKLQLEEKEQREKEAQSLYKMKSTKEVEEAELKKTFPLFHQEFEDVAGNVVYQKMDADVQITDTDAEPEDFDLITDEDMASIGYIHEQVFVSTTQKPWLEKPVVALPEYNVEPLKCRLEVLNSLLPHAFDSLDNTFDKALSGTFLLALNHDTDYSKRPYDFYRDPLPSEAVKGLPLLKAILQRVHELMQEWPEHPTLQTLETLCDRLMTFPSKSPLARFLCGFELLLSQLQSWEAHAHTGVSMGALSQAVADLVLEWRRLELQKWTEALDSVEYKCKQKAFSRWWCHLATLIDPTGHQDSFSVQDVISAIQQFMEQSTMGDFAVRLRLLKAFYCQASHGQGSQLQDLQKVLWNAFTFYSQFLQPVLNRLKSLRAPIEKKLKEAVKIARWTETNYWALRQKIEKTHRTLFKHMRDYQEVLDQKASTAMNVPPVVLKEWSLEMNVLAYLSSIKSDSTLLQDDSLGANSWFKKAQKLCKDMMSSYRYPEIIKQISNIVLEIEDTTKLVLSQGASPGKNGDKDKFKSDQKNLLQRKRKAVADTFKSIQQLGVSYRTGTIHKFNFSLEYFLMDPFDVLACNGAPQPKPEDDLQKAWSGCKEQLAACVAKMSQLSAALTKPSSELGPNDLEKCQGNALHLMEMLVNEHNLLSKVSKDANMLGVHLQPLLDASVYPAENYNHTREVISNIVGSAAVWISQFTILLKAYPKSDGLDNVQLMPNVKTLNTLSIAQALESAESLLSNVESIRSILLRLDDCCPIVGEVSLGKLNNCKPFLEDMTRKITKLKDVAPSCTVDTIDWLHNELLRAVALISIPLTTSSSGVHELDVLLEKTQRAALLKIQKLYQSLKSRPQSSSETEFEEIHLLSNAKKTLKEDVDLLSIGEISKLVAELDLVLAQSPEALAEVKKIAPLIHQVQMLAKYFVVQLASSLNVSSQLLCQYLCLATMLVQKGFNMPPEMADEKEGEGESEPSQGMGLCDGEGEKDVSDRLESEDQLEGARQEGDPEEEPADKDIPEEDNGVDVSDDFEGKLQDVGKNKEGEDDDGSGDEEGDEDVDKQMGETGEETENLDKEVWGSDEEEEEGEMDETENAKGEKDDVVPEIGAAEDGEGPEGTQEKKDWDAQQQNEFPEDQVDTQHAKNEQPPEPEALDLPDELKLDGDQEDENNEDESGENPFEIEELKDIKEQPEVEENAEPMEEKSTEENQMDADDSGDDEEQNFEKTGDSKEGDEEGEDSTDKEQEGRGEEMDEDTPENQDVEPDKDYEGEDKAESNEDKAEAAQSAKSQDKASLNDSTFDQKENNWGGEADEDKGQEGVAEQDEGHASASQKDSKMAAPAEKQIGKQEPRKRKKPGKTDDSHTLGDVKEPVQKKLRLADDMAMETGEDEHSEEEEGMQKDDGADLHQHVKEAKSSTSQTMDAATKEQAIEQKPVVGQEDDKPPKDEEMEIVEEEEEEKNDGPQKELKAEKTKGVDKPEKSQDGQQPRGETSKEQVEVEGDIVNTENVPRGGACTAHTQIMEKSCGDELSPEEVQALREHLEKQLASWTAPPASSEAFQTWTQFLSATSALSRDLCEQLRLVLEPTQAARLMGDFRTGRRINMRKVIPYIASEFRKDKIWLRRTKPSRRRYQIVLALDDSSSMAENHSKELAFESLALVSQALTLLEAGELGVVSFGEEPKILHQLETTFNEESGARLLQQLSFNQRQTRVGRMVNFVSSMLIATGRQSNSDVAQLLLIVSDGRGIFSEGREVVEQAVRAAKEAGVFIIFLAIEDPQSKDSILDIRMPVFHNGKLQMISSYLENFPFPYYLILRDIESLPSVLSDALRQWFELVAADVRK